MVIAALLSAECRWVTAQNTEASGGYNLKTRARRGRGRPGISTSPHADGPELVTLGSALLIAAEQHPSSQLSDGFPGPGSGRSPVDSEEQRT